MPHPIEKIKYLDSKNVQYLIRGNGNFDLKQSSYLYKDDRGPILHYVENREYSDLYLKEINNKINALLYKQYDSDNNIDNYNVVDVSDYKEIYCNDDWCVITFKDGNEIKYIDYNDERAIEEIENIKKDTEKILKKQKKC